MHGEAGGGKPAVGEVPGPGVEPDAWPSSSNHTRRMAATAEAYETTGNRSGRTRSKARLVMRVVTRMSRPPPPARSTDGSSPVPFTCWSISNSRCTGALVSSNSHGRLAAIQASRQGTRTEHRGSITATASTGVALLAVSAPTDVARATEAPIPVPRPVPALECDAADSAMGGCAPFLRDWPIEATSEGYIAPTAKFTSTRVKARCLQGAACRVVIEHSVRDRFPNVNSEPVGTATSNFELSTSAASQSQLSTDLSKHDRQPARRHASTNEARQSTSVASRMNARPFVAI